MSIKKSAMMRGLLGSSSLPFGTGGGLTGLLGGGHTHGPGCGHDHSHDHDNHAHGHVHGPDCNHDHDHDEECGK